MKKVLLTIAAIALFATPAVANVYSIWGDQARTTCELAGEPSTNYMFHVYIFADPGDQGNFGGQYKLSGPLDHFNLFNTLGPATSSAVIGPWYNGVGVAYATTSCQNDMFMVVDMTMMASTAAYYSFGPNEDTDQMSMTSCIGDRPILDATAYNEFGVWLPCNIGTQESTWGAIKSMMD